MIDSTPSIDRVLSYNCLLRSRDTPLAVLSNLKRSFMRRSIPLAQPRDG